MAKATGFQTTNIRMKKVYCASCGMEIDEEIGAYMFRDNFLILKYFDDYKSNRFCSMECACDALFGGYVDFSDLPLDDDEEEIEQE